MRTSIVLILLMLAGSTLLQAQVPGYLGKRCLILFDSNLTPAFINQNINNTVSINPGVNARTDKRNVLAFNIRPHVTIEYLVHRDISIGLSYSIIRTGTVRAYEDGPEKPNDYAHLQDPDVIKGSSAGLHFKFYSFNKSSSIAPIGFYQMLSVYMTQTNTYDNKKSNIKMFQNDFLYPVVSYSFGKQVVLNKRFLIKSGFELGWACVPINYVTDERNWTVQEQSGYNVHGSLLGYYLFNINIALGILAF